MNLIVKAKQEDFQLLCDIGKKSFIESHGDSASETDINEYANANYNSDKSREELSDDKNIYYIIHHNERPAGYSKIIFNSFHKSISMGNVTKLERLYLLKEFYDLKLGLEIFEFNIELSKQNNQAGMWLFVWKDNQRAVKFYERAGFEIIGNYDFKISETHSNPNYQMLLEY